MTAHEHMKKHLRTLSGGGIAWERHIFQGTPGLEPQALVDAAVDLAWMRLMPDTLERPGLEIEAQGKLLVFRVRRYSLEQVLVQAA